jgi:hypothetical protein
VGAPPVALRKAPEAEDEADDRDVCAVSGCGKPAKRHMPAGRVSGALPREKIKGGGRSVGLCKDHYREFKKATRADRELDRAGW